MQSSKTYLISVVGPTAVGKTSMAIRLAQHFSTEVISADSRQIYRELTIGAAKPTKAEQQGIPHHFMDILPISTGYNAGMFERDVLTFLSKYFIENNSIIMVGGSGLYCKAVWQGFDDLPEIDTEIRETLNRQVKENGLAPLLKELELHDRTYFSKADLQNTQRVIRAVEVLRATGKPYSSFLGNVSAVVRPFVNCKIGLEMDRESLYNQINLRVDQMMADGLVEEVRSLIPFKHLNALQTVGYSELFDYFEGKHNLEEAIRLIKRNTRRFAKRQLTWFKKDPEIRWFHPSQWDEIIAAISEKLDT